MKRQELSPEAVRIYETPLPVEEFNRRVAEALADEDQMQQNMELIRWFCRRYPTAGDRLAYVRRKYPEWIAPMERVERPAEEKPSPPGPLSPSGRGGTDAEPASSAVTARPTDKS